MQDEGAWAYRHPADDEAGLAAYLLRRRAGIQARTRQLHERMSQLAELRRGDPVPDAVERAREHADRAQQAAREACRHAAESHDEAAAVHLRVAAAFDRFGWPDRAREHRAAAAANRVNAASDRDAVQRAHPW